MTNYTVAELEQKIMDGGSVSAAELADATRLADAAKRIAQLTAERTKRTAQSDIEQLGALNRRVASDNLTPQQRTVAALEILDLEQKNIGAKK
jgi:hypothetical protein